MLARLPSPLRLRVAEAPLAAASLLAIANAIDIEATLRMPPGGLPVRAAHHAFDAGLTLAVGLVAGLAIGTIGHASRHRPHVGRLVYLAVGVVLARLVLVQDLRHQAEYVAGGVLGSLLLTLFVVLCGAALPVAHGLGQWCGERRIWRVLALVVGCGGIAASHLVVRDDYAAFHASIEWTAATIAMGALGPIVARRRARSPHAGRSAWRLLTIGGLAGLFLSPSNRTRVELFQTPGAIGAWALARTLWTSPYPDVRARPPLGDAAPTLRAPPSRDGSTNTLDPRTSKTISGAVPRLAEGPTPPTQPPLVEGAPVVVMITIDATRGDVVLDAPTASTLPFFTDLRRNAATFTHAISPGSQTSVSLTTFFSGRYFSQLYWSRYGKGPSRFLYAAEDDTPRFPEILAANGVQTALFGGTNFLANEYGVARGFASTKVPEGRRHAMANEIIDPLIARINQAGAEPLFLYGHIMEPHSPYDRGKKKGTDFERYVSEVGVADAQVARVSRALTQRFPTRGVLIISADHGEAFGEHGTYQHTKTLYDELLHVPLFVKGAKVKARRIDARVSLADIAPTILDLFGLPTPAGSVGQSLVPMLRGDSETLTRPLIAEGRLRRALYVGDVKVIEDTRRKLVEAYDLARDPKELVNLFDDDDPRALSALATLRAFFEAYELRRPGYTAPYKP